MRVEEETTGASERRVLAACVVSAEFLSRVAGRVGREPFRSRWANLVWGWCAEHHKAHQTAPGSAVGDYYEKWAAGTKDRDAAGLVSSFLSAVSGEEVGQTDYLLALAERHFNFVLEDRLRDEMQRRLAAGESCREILANHTPVMLTAPPALSLTQAGEQFSLALAEKYKPLVSYPGAAGEFFGTEFGEDAFVAFMAPPKGGKSYALLDVAWRGFLQGRKVAYFQVGDLSRNQILLRFLRRAAYRPLDARTFKVPKGIVLPAGTRELAVVEHEERRCEKPLSQKAAQGVWQRMREKTGGDIRLSHHPIRSITVPGIRGVLDAWDLEGWKADVVVIDYAGNLAPTDGKANPVVQTDYNWAQMRLISDVRRCLVVTANQTNKEGFRAWVLTRSNFADSKMILAHVTAFLGVNMTDEEKQNGVLRYNFVVRREEEFNESFCLYAGTCLAVANPVVVSCLPR